MNNRTISIFYVKMVRAPTPNVRLTKRYILVMVDSGWVELLGFSINVLVKYKGILCKPTTQPLVI